MRINASGHNFLEFILEGRALFQAPDTDGKLYVTDGIADNGSGPYRCIINKIAYPDIYVKSSCLQEQAG